MARAVDKAVKPGYSIEIQSERSPVVVPIVDDPDAVRVIAGTNNGDEGTVTVQGPSKNRLDKYDVRVAVLKYASTTLGMRSPGLGSSIRHLPGFFSREGKTLQGPTPGAEVRGVYEVTASRG